MKKQDLTELENEWAMRHSDPVLISMKTVVPIGLSREFQERLVSFVEEYRKKKGL